MTSITPGPSTTRLNPLEAAMERLNLSRSTIFALIGSGKLRTVKVGRRRLVPESAIGEFIERLESETHTAGKSDGDGTRRAATSDDHG